MTTFRINAVPVAQPRQRHRIVKGAKGTFASNYTPKSDPVNAFKAAVMEQALRNIKAPYTSAVDLRVCFYLPRPKSHYRASGAIKSGAETYKASRPDVDNHLKSLLDALNSIAWVDDAQVVKVLVEKRYCDEENPVGCDVEIKPLTEQKV